eukprot:COSAG01_NODE_2781_length_7087_cov_36.916428_7_plen_61_part_00
MALALWIRMATQPRQRKHSAQIGLYNTMAKAQRAPQRTAAWKLQLWRVSVFTLFTDRVQL